MIYVSADESMTDKLQLFMSRRSTYIHVYIYTHIYMYTHIYTVQWYIHTYMCIYVST